MKLHFYICFWVWLMKTFCPKTFHFLNHIWFILLWNNRQEVISFISDFSTLLIQYHHVHRNWQQMQAKDKIWCCKQCFTNTHTHRSKFLRSAVSNIFSSTKETPRRGSGTGEVRGHGAGVKEAWSSALTLGKWFMSERTRCGLPVTALLTLTHRLSGLAQLSFSTCLFWSESLCSTDCLPHHLSVSCSVCGPAAR